MTCHIFILASFYMSTEMDFWRRSALISSKDKIRNNVIKEKINVTRSLLDDVKTKQLQLYGHVRSLGEGRLPKMVLEWRPSGGRKRGRPKLTGRRELEEGWQKRGYRKEIGQIETIGGGR
jgi:hypothetical protein